MKQSTQVNRGFQSGRRGVVLVFTMVMLVVLLGFAALTVDVGLMYNTRNDLQSTADAAALAGAQQLPDLGAARAAALAYARRNYPGAKDVVESTGITFGNWDASLGTFTANDLPINAVNVIARRSSRTDNALGLVFAQVFGRRTTNVSASATAAMTRMKRWDVVLVQDVTGSFVDEIDEARTADQNLLDCIQEHAPDTLFGLVTFTGYGQTSSGLRSVDEGYATLSQSIQSIRNCGQSGMPPCSGTNIGAGLDQAITILSTSTSHDLPKAIILVTDGMPQSSLRGYTDQDLANWAMASADRADALGISIFTLFYSGNDGRAGADDFLAGLVRGEGTAHETPNPAEIDTELQDICLEGMTLMLVQ